MRDFIETVRMWNLGFRWSEARWRVRVHHQTAKQMHAELVRLFLRQPRS